MSMFSSRVDDAFTRLLQDFDPGALANTKNIIFGLWPDLTLAYFNQAWSDFAAENGGESIPVRWNLNSMVLDAISPVLRPFFANHYLQALAESRPWVHSYECSSAEVRRKFHMKCFPLGNSEGLLVVNSLRVESAHSRVEHEPCESLYRRADGMILLCSHCRRVKRADGVKGWDWAPDWVTRPPRNCSHGLCDFCVGFYYSERRQLGGYFPEVFVTGGEPDE